MAKVGLDPVGMRSALADPVNIGCCRMALFTLRVDCNDVWMGFPEAKKALLPGAPAMACRQLPPLEASVSRVSGGNRDGR